MLYQTDTIDPRIMKVVYTWSKDFNDEESRYSQVEKEALEMVLAFEK